MEKQENQRTRDELHLLQRLPLDIKIGKTKQRIREWYEYNNGDVYVAFSGGKDSTVLLDLVRQIYPEVPAVFCNTGLEYPEIREFVKSIDNVTILYPPMNFVEVIKTYGYPMISKEVSAKINTARKTPNGKMRNRFTPNNEHDKKSGHSVVKWAPLLDVDFMLSARCCDVMKKTPFKRYEKKTGYKGYLGILAEESDLRMTQWIQYGCNAYNNKRPLSKPLSFWTEQDILKYITENKLPIASVYGDIVFSNGKYRTTKCNRTGCMFCGFGAQIRGDSRYKDLKLTHPKQYQFLMNGGEFQDGLWKPNKYGLGMEHVIKEINKIYGDDYIEY